MKVLKQKFVSDNEEIAPSYEITHIYSETGYFRSKGDRKKKSEGWHIQLGTGASKDDYSEIKGDEAHEVPEALEDINFHAMTEEEIQAEMQKNESMAVSENESLEGN